MGRKKIDTRLRTLIDNGVKTNHRSFIVLVGDRGRHQVVNLHYMLTKAVVKARPSLLWCYKNELGFSSHRKKRMRQVKKQKDKGVYDTNEDNPFELFISSTDIRYCYYKDTHKILGQTYGMLVLQDFEAITPNLLARTVETVEGGGLVVLLLKTMKSLRQLYTMSMDIHARYRTEAHQDVVARFNERFLLSLSNCKQSLVLDDEFNVLPISSHAISIAPVHVAKLEESGPAVELKGLKAALADTQPAGCLVENARSLDQAKALLTFVEAISEKTLRSTVTLTAGRGRGKSAALGLAIAAAVSYGYSNIFVTSPTPENLNTVFEFIFKGLDSLQYEEHLDYNIIQSSNPDFHKAVVRVDIFRQHRQTIQYILPQDASKLGQAELVVIDEAAAIPLPYVKALLGPYLVFMASTINGYEGTGRALSLKLIQQLRERSNVVANGASSSDGNNTQTSAGGGRVLREIVLKEPIRYGEDDPVESWLNKLLCLDASVDTTPVGGCPHPDNCDLYFINRDTLMSYHKASESFLQKMMALYVSSHYKNSPNDLQLMSDAPAHQLFCLLGPLDSTKNALPEILCVVQVCLEGEISKESVAASLAKGKYAAGDLIPWTVSQQYQDKEFASLSGARIVRIATHPAYQKMGYGSRAVDLLKSYYQGDIPNISEEEDVIEKEEENITIDVPLAQEKIRARKNLPPLLSKLSERKPERLHYLGSSFGITENLFKFWKKSGFSPVYLRHTPNELTGEHTCIVLCPLNTEGMSVSAPEGWLDSFVQDFRHRFICLLSYQFSNFSPKLALAVLDKINNSSTAQLDSPESIEKTFSQFDLKRLEAYSKGLVDYHIILDLIPRLASLYFMNQIPVSLSAVQAAIFVSMGLQRREVDHVKETLDVPVAQLLSLFNRAIKKITANFDETLKQSIHNEMITQREVIMTPMEKGVDEQLQEEGSKVSKEMQRKLNEMMTPAAQAKYKITGTNDEWDTALKSSKGKAQISLKSTKRPKEDEDEVEIPAAKKFSSAKKPKQKKNTNKKTRKSVA